MLSMVSPNLRLAYETGRRAMAEGNGNGNGRYALVASYMSAILQVVTTGLGVGAVIWALATTEARTQAQQASTAEQVGQILTAMQKYEQDHDQIIHMRPELDTVERQVEMIERVEQQLNSLDSAVREQGQQVRELFSMYGKGGSEVPQSSKMEPKR